uniref:DDE_Tnp_ISL3 domain-containing protein n=1 Tax=Haemonchus contortus TaxID=6289 RepID=A0A7I5E938_HAECO
MKPEIGATLHFYDGWHLAKWLGNELRKVSKLDGCGEIGAWIEKLKTHLWNAIKYAADSNTDVRAIFSTCLMQLRSQFQDVLTGPYTRCSHGPPGDSRTDFLAAGNELLRSRLEALQERREDSSEAIADLMAADDRYECEL